MLLKVNRQVLDTGTDQIPIRNTVADFYFLLIPRASGSAAEAQDHGVL
jgi:hypothetical protein